MFATESPTTVEASALETKAQAIAEVLSAHRAFGNIGPTYSRSEKQGFINSVTAHAMEETKSKKLELTYRSSCVRLTVRTKVVAGEATLRKITVSDHPYRNTAIDYEALNRDIQAVFAE